MFDVFRREVGGWRIVSDIYVPGQSSWARGESWTVNAA
jgi:hypothetical protein